jgi:hypothetical protein
MYCSNFATTTAENVMNLNFYQVTILTGDNNYHDFIIKEVSRKKASKQARAKIKQRSDYRILTCKCDLIDFRRDLTPKAHRLSTVYKNSIDNCSDI